MKLKTDDICPEDYLFIVLPADKIPDRATVFKPTGETAYTFRRNITLYPINDHAAKPVVIAGFFLVKDGGDINQVRDSQKLKWRVTAQDFVDIIREAWEAPPQ